jgi:hypothetical protein
VLAHRPDPDDASAQIDLIGVPWMIVSQEPSAVPNGGSGARLGVAVSQSENEPEQRQVHRGDRRGCPVTQNPVGRPVTRPAEDQGKPCRIIAR